jgi:5-methylcytosine-specific restriction endonuclease McrA
MSRSYVPKGLREQIFAEARHRCGYCLTSSKVTGTPMEIDHLIPESLGGLTVRENLWLACSMAQLDEASSPQVASA